MRFSINFALLTCSILSSVVHAGASKLPLVIYGEDGRQEVYEASSINQKLAKSTATMIPNSHIYRFPFSKGIVRINQTTFQDWIQSVTTGAPDEEMLMLTKAVPNAVQGMSFCSGERFVDQPNAGMCSGFLIAPDLLVTAGHCATEANSCTDASWVFDFQVDPITKKAGINIKEESIYRCKKIVSTTLNNNFGLDYAVFQLDRIVTDREPLEIRSKDKIEDMAPLVVIGSPSGLPLKVTVGGNVRKNIHPFYFTANLDTYQGNSGSAVFNANTGVVEGILVRGENDFVPSPDLSCIQSNRCSDTGCRGEDVSRMTSIPEVALKAVLTQAAITGDVAKLDLIIQFKLWADFYGKDRVSNLMKASAVAKVISIEKLIASGADVNLADLKGNTPLHYLATTSSLDSGEAIAKLVEANANLEAKNAEGLTPVLAAANKLNLAVVKSLIRAGANMNAQDKNGESVLFPFSRAGDLKSVLELNDLGVDTAIKNGQGKDILDLKNEKGEIMLLRGSH